VLNRRTSRLAASGFLLAVAVSGLTGCRTSPSVASYVGDEQVSVSELDAAVDERTADEQVAAFAATNEAEYARQVLTILVQKEVYDAAAERYDVEVTDAQVRARIDELLGDDDPDTVFGQLAEQGIARADVVETVRQQLLRREIALAEGQAEEPTDEELQAAYEEARADLAEYRFGYITVPDQATADALAAQLQANPATYAAAAQQHAGQFTLAAVEQRALSEIPGPLTQQISAAAPNTAFTLSVPDVPGVIVTFVGGVVYPTFEEMRPQLEQDFVETADQAGTALVDDVRADLDVVTNPRYGELDETGQIVPAEGGVVDILGDEDAADAASGGAGG
jgi:peptidyl-prolyl cis-trans isomerase SurA